MLGSLWQFFQCGGQGAHAPFEFMKDLLKYCLPLTKFAAFSSIFSPIDDLGKRTLPKHIGRAKFRAISMAWYVHTTNTTSLV